MDPVRRSHARAHISNPNEAPDAPAASLARTPHRLNRGVGSVLQSYRPSLSRFVAAQRKAVAQAAAPARTPVQQKLDAFMNRMNAGYQVGGHTVRVTPGFRMNTGYGPSVAKARDAILAKLPQGAVPMSTIGWVVSGKGTPEQIKTVTQALIDAGALRDVAAPDQQTAIRKMMFAYGIGCDCSGYTYQAYAAAHGTRFNPDLAPGRLVSRDARDAQPGDVIRLVAADGSTGAGSGHKVMVYSHQVRPAGSPPPSFPGRPPVPASFTSGGPVHVFELDSSWGGGPTGSYGGVQRGVWLLNESTGKWANYVPKDGSFHVSDTGPYDHALGGVYR